MMSLIIVLAAYAVVSGYLHYHTLRTARRLHQRMDAATTARQSFREGGRLLRERLDKRFGVRVTK